MKQLVLQKGTFIVVPTPEKAHSFTNDLAPHQINFIIEEGGLSWGDCILLRDYWNMKLELIGLISEILKDEELSKKVVDTTQCINGEVYEHYVAPGGGKTNIL